MLFESHWASNVFSICVSAFDPIFGVVLDYSVIFLFVDGRRALWFMLKHMQVLSSGSTRLQRFKDVRHLIRMCSCAVQMLHVFQQI